VAREEGEMRRVSTYDGAGEQRASERKRRYILRLLLEKQGSRYKVRGLYCK
jgi:hypothetical protein